MYLLMVLAKYRPVINRPKSIGIGIIGSYQKSIGPIPIPNFRGNFRHLEVKFEQKLAKFLASKSYSTKTFRWILICNSKLKNKLELMKFRNFCYEGVLKNLPHFVSTESIGIDCRLIGLGIGKYRYRPIPKNQVSVHRWLLSKKIQSLFELRLLNFQSN